MLPCPTRAVVPGRLWSCAGAFTVPVHAAQRGARVVIARNKLGDDLLDYISAGPKLRKWYGQGERMPRDGAEDEPELEPEEEADDGNPVIFVTNAESDMGEQVLLQLILRRANVKGLFKNTAIAAQSYGQYVRPVSVDVNSQNGALSALKGVNTLVCLGSEGKLIELARRSGVKQIVMLQLCQPSSSLFSFMDAEGAALRDASRAAAVQASGLPYTIVRAASLNDTPTTSVSVSQSQSGGPISREGAAILLSSITSSPPPSGSQEVQVSGTSSGGVCFGADMWTAMQATLQG